MVWFGAAWSGFGAAWSGFGVAWSGFGVAWSGFGAAWSGFGAAWSGFGVAWSGFGAVYMYVHGRVFANGIYAMWVYLCMVSSHVCMSTLECEVSDYATYGDASRVLGLCWC